MKNGNNFGERATGKKTFRAKKKNDANLKILPDINFGVKAMKADAIIALVPTTNS